MSHNPFFFIKRTAILFSFLGGGLILHLFCPIPTYSKPPVSTEKYQNRGSHRKPPQYCKAKDGSTIRIGDIALEKISPEYGGGKSLEFVLPEDGDECTPKNLKKVHSIQGIKTIGLYIYSGDAELNALRGYHDLQDLSIGENVTGDGLSVLKTFPNLKRIWFWGSPKLKGIGLENLAKCSNLERLNAPSFLSGTDYKPLLKMKKLKKLSIAVNKDSIATIPQLRHLEELSFNVLPSDITSKELALMLSQLKSLKQLKKIAISTYDSPSVITAEVVEEISKMESLEILYLPGIQNKDFKKIGRLKSLKSIFIGNRYRRFHLKNSLRYDFSQLKGMKKLERISINGKLPPLGLKILK
ncbi:hypothetical protein MNBD_BACTEROID05-955, partial [hydrothermal vent metagenome]